MCREDISKKYDLIILISLVGLLAGCTPFSEEPPQSSLLRMAERMHATGNDHTALSFYNKALIESPAEEKCPIAQTLGLMLIQHHKVEEAIKIYEYALSFCPDNSTIKSLLAYSYIKIGQADYAIGLFQELIQTEAENVGILNGMGMAYILKKDFTQAKSKFMQALALDPDNEGLKSNIGLTLALSGHSQEALKWLTPIGSRRDATSQQRANLAIAYALQGDQHKAYELFIKNLSQDAIQSNLFILKQYQTKLKKANLS